MRIEAPGRPLLAGGLLLLAAACAIQDTRDDTAGNQAATTEQARLLQNIAALLPGRYSNHLQWRENEAEALYELDISMAPVDSPDRLVFQLVQADAGGHGMRRFRLSLTPGRPGNLSGELQSLGGAGEARGRCPMVFTATDAGFTGETDPRTCMFGSSGRRVGLLKEIAFDGVQVLIADRVVGSGEQARGEADQVLRFYRTRRFNGWAGVRKNAESDWRIADDVQLHSEGGTAEPKDRRGHTLGIRVQLARVRWREDQPPILRLAVYDGDDLIGYAWADPDARELGISLETLQVGLRAE